MHDRELRVIGWGILAIYVIVVISMIWEFHTLTAFEWTIVDWSVMFIIVALMPGVPGMLLIIPTTLLTGPVRFLCKLLGIVGIILAFSWGFLLNPEWWILAAGGVVLQFIAHQVGPQQSVLV